MKSLLFSLIFCFFSIITFAQKSEYPAASIADSLKENANAVIRLDQTDITILSQRSMNAKNHRVVTVFNEKGFDASEAYEFYDKSTSVKNIEAIIYDASGKERK
jgi:hypothetical protein